MIRRPPRSTRTDTLFPYTTLFRSGVHEAGWRWRCLREPFALPGGRFTRHAAPADQLCPAPGVAEAWQRRRGPAAGRGAADPAPAQRGVARARLGARSPEGTQIGKPDGWEHGCPDVYMSVVAVSFKKNNK